MLMCLAAMRIYAGYKPFIDENNDLLAETAQWQLFLTMFAALLIRVNADQESLQDRGFFDALLCAVQFAGVGVGLFKIGVSRRSKEGEAEAKREVENSRKITTNDKEQGIDEEIKVAMKPIGANDLVAKDFSSQKKEGVEL